MVLPSEGAYSFFSSSHQRSLSPHSRAGPVEGICPLCRNLAALVVNRTHADNHSCMEFMRATVPSWPEVRISHHSFPSSDSPFPLLPPFQCSSNLGGCWEMKLTKRSYWRISTHSLVFPALWPVTVCTDCERKPLQWRVEVTQVFGSKQKCLDSNLVVWPLSKLTWAASVLGSLICLAMASGQDFSTRPEIPYRGVALISETSHNGMPLLHQLVRLAWQAGFVAYRVQSWVGLLMSFLPQ